MGKLGKLAHERHDKSGSDTKSDRKKDEEKLVRSHPRAQPSSQRHLSTLIK
ncbi:hypothetical protein GCM10022626_18550 [[Pseudomonas] carboxydohydrogena]